MRRGNISKVQWQKRMTASFINKINSLVGTYYFLRNILSLKRY